MRRGGGGGGCHEIVLGCCKSSPLMESTCQKCIPGPHKAGVESSIRAVCLRRGTWHDTLCIHTWPPCCNLGMLQPWQLVLTKKPDRWEYMVCLVHRLIDSDLRDWAKP